MFNDCSSLKEIIIENFNTKNVENMKKMFFRCLSLEKLYISNFIITNVLKYGKYI